MTYYEYSQETIDKNKIIQRLNELGSDGWELCSSKEFDDGYTEFDDGYTEYNEHSKDFYLSEKSEKGTELPDNRGKGVWISNPQLHCIFKREVK